MKNYLIVFIDLLNNWEIIFISHVRKKIKTNDLFFKVTSKVVLWQKFKNKKKMKK